MDPHTALQPSAGSTSSPRRLSSDNRTGNHPLGRRDPENAPSTTSQSRTEPPAPDGGGSGKQSRAKRRKNRNRKRQNRQQSFLTPGMEDSHDRSEGKAETGGVRESMEDDRPRSRDKPPFFKLGRNLSNTSLESDALLDHR